MNFKSTLQKHFFASKNRLDTFFYYEVNPEQKEIHKNINGIPTFKYNPNINLLSETFFNLINSFKISSFELLIDKHIKLKADGDIEKEIIILTEMRSDYNKVANRKIHLEESSSKSHRNDSYFQLKSEMAEFNDIINSKLELLRAQKTKSIKTIELIEETNHLLDITNYKTIKDNDSSLSDIPATEEEKTIVKKYQEFTALIYNNNPYPSIPKKTYLRHLLSLANIDITKREIVVLINDTKGKEFEKIRDTDKLFWELYNDIVKFTFKPKRNN